MTFEKARRQDIRVCMCECEGSALGSVEWMMREMMSWCEVWLRKAVLGGAERTQGHREGCLMLRRSCRGLQVQNVTLGETCRR